MGCCTTIGFALLVSVTALVVFSTGSMADGTSLDFGKPSQAVHG